MNTEGTETQPHAKAPSRWTFTVEAVGPGAPTVCRVRRLLKAAWRAYGLRALEVKELPDAEPHRKGDA